MILISVPVSKSLHKAASGSVLKVNPLYIYIYIYSRIRKVREEDDDDDPEAGAFQVENPRFVGRGCKIWG